MSLKKSKSSQTKEDKHTSKDKPCPRNLRKDGEDSDDKGAIRIFVYGSLKSEMGNNSLLRQVGAKCLGLDSITGPFRMISLGGFPAVVHGAPNGEIKTIFGETWMTNEEGLATTDLLEHHPDWYERFKYRTDILDRRAWMYTFPYGQGYLDRHRFPRVEECIWRPTDAELKFYNEQPGVSISA